MNLIEKFVNTKKKTNTQDVYRQALIKYFDVIKADPNNYFNDKRDYKQDIKQFVNTLDKYAPITQKAYFSVIKRFFYKNDIELTTKFWEEQKEELKKPYALTLDDKPSIQQLKTILSYADLKQKTLFLTLASSGMRISELLKITPDHIDFKSNPCVISLESTMTKTGRPRRVLISNEAKELLQQWLNEGGRERYLKELEDYMTGIHKVDRNDNRVFPMQSCAVRLWWKRLITKANLTKRSIETKRYVLHVHSLRKFFISQLSTAIPEVIVRGLCGHSKYLDESYNRYTLEEVKKYYLEGVHKVSIFSTTSEDIKQVNEEIIDLRKKEEEMKMQILELRLTVQELKNSNKKDINF